MGLDQRIEYLEMKERHKKHLRPWYRRWWGIILILLSVLILATIIASAIYFVNQVKAIRSGQDTQSQQAELNKITAAIDGNGESYSLGPAKAPIQIMMFMDFACPFCKDSAPMVEQLHQKYGDKVRLTFRNYPLHKNSVTLALAANCAGEQSQFWPMYKLLFDQQDEIDKLSGDSLNKKLNSLASQLNIGNEQFSSCLSSKKYLYRLNDDFADAELLGLAGTPTWFVNHYKITGSYPQANFEQLIDGLLSQQK